MTSLANNSAPMRRSTSSARSAVSSQTVKLATCVSCGRELRAREGARHRVGDRVHDAGLAGDEDARDAGVGGRSFAGRVDAREVDEGIGQELAREALDRRALELRREQVAASLAHGVHVFDGELVDARARLRAVGIVDPRAPEDLDAPGGPGRLAGPLGRGARRRRVSRGSSGRCAARERPWREAPPPVEAARSSSTRPWGAPAPEATSRWPRS